MNKIKLLPGLMRAPFLALAPACIAVGIGSAYGQTHEFHWARILLVLLGGLAAHISVNMFNEYYDFKSGLDARTRSTPFSGGSGTLPAHPKMANAALALACTAFAVTAGVGVYFVWREGWLLLPIGFLGLLLLVTYTTGWVYHPLPSLIAPGLGFGVLMVTGTHIALTGAFSGSALAASLLPTFLVSDLLLLNQFPDVEADRAVGRRHFPITIGRKKSSALYGVFLLLAYLSVVVSVAAGWLPVTALLALLPAVLAARAFQIARQNADNIPGLIPAMGMNVVINLISPLLLAVGLILG